MTVTRNQVACLVIGGLVSFILYAAGIYTVNAPAILRVVENVSLLFLGGLLLVAFLWRPDHLLVGFYVFWSFGAAVPGLYLIAEEAYLIELRQTGYPANSFSALQLYVYLALAVFAVVFRRNALAGLPQQRPSRRTRSAWNGISTATSLLAIALNLYFLKTVGGIGSVVDRFEFQANISLPFAIYLANQASLLFLSTYGAALSRGWIAVGCCFFSLATSAILLYGIGVKFTGFVFLAVVVGIGIYLARGMSAAAVRASMVGMVALSAVLLFVVVVRNYEKGGAASGGDELLVRTPGQSQLFWITHATGSLFVPPEDAWDRSLRLTGFGANGRAGAGIVELMYAYAPVDVVDRYRQRGVVFTFGYPAVLVYAYGFVFAPLAHLGVIACYALVMRWAFQATVLMRRLPVLMQALSLLVFIKLFTVGIRIITNGDFHELFKFIAAFVVLWCLVVVLRGRYEALSREG